MSVYIYRNDQQEGPFSLEDLRSMLDADELSLDVLSWTEGANEWRPLSALLPPKKFPPMASSRPSAPTKRSLQSFPQTEPPKESSKSTSPVAIFFAVLLAIVVGGGILFWVFRSSTPQAISGYETQVFFVSDADYTSQSEFRRLTEAGWEIKNSRRAWTKHPYLYDQKQWGTEYTLQKPIYGRPD
jgi:hypothetical protein